MTGDDRGRRRQGSGGEGDPRVPPHDLAAEESLLGASMLSSEALEVLATKTTPADFYKPAHGHIAAILTDAYEEGWPADPITVADRLRRTGLLDAIGGPAVLVSLQVSTPATSNAGRYASIIHDHATLRRLIGSAGEIAELGYSLPDDVHDAVHKAQGTLANVAANNGARAYSNLQSADVASILQGDFEVEQAEILTRTDGKRLFYAGKMHMLQAEPSSAKSWLALLASVEVLGLGGAVVYIDYEDSAKGIVGRLLALQAEPAAVAGRFRYIRIDGPFTPAERVELERVIADINPDLIVIDGVAEALSRDGYDEDKAKDVVAWFEKVPRWLARTGAAVAMLDHVTKSKENRGRDPRGSGHKRAAIDGAAYEVVVIEAFSRHRSGSVKLVIAKDRPGGVGAIGETAAVAKIEPAGDGAIVRITLDPPSAGTSTADSWKPTRLMEQVSREVEKSTSILTSTTVKAIVHGKAKLVEEAIARLVAEGYLRSAKSASTTYLHLIKPYRADGDPGPHEPPPDSGGRDFGDEQLFAEFEPPPDELADRRRSKDEEEPDA